MEEKLSKLEKEFIKLYLRYNTYYNEFPISSMAEQDTSNI